MAHLRNVGADGLKCEITFAIVVDIECIILIPRHLDPTLLVKSKGATLVFCWCACHFEFSQDHEQIWIIYIIIYMKDLFWASLE